MKLIVGLWALTAALLLATFCLVGLPGRMLGGFAGMALGIATCITCVKLGGRV
jgi:hypothetical protein